MSKKSFFNDFSLTVFREPLLVPLVLVPFIRLVLERAMLLRELKLPKQLNRQVKPLRRTPLSFLNNIQPKIEEGNPLIS
jgi:hypothetical protein